MAMFQRLTMLWFAFLWLSVCRLAHGSDKSFRLSMTRDTSAAKTADLPSDRLPSLYWTTDVSVGDSPSLKLAVDTGSSDILVNPGIYKPSKYRQPYPGKKKFAAGFEGVNRAGYGFVQIAGKLQKDIVSAGGFSVKDQAVGTITSYNLSDTHPLPEPVPGQGILGFAGTADSQFQPQAPSWVYNLYKQGSIAANRFGLAYGTGGKGQIVIGTFDQALTEGSLYNARQLDPGGAYILTGDVYVNNKKVFTKQHFIMDVGTTNIQSPLGQAKNIFKSLGYETTSKHDKNIGVTILSAYFPCNKPPMLGFSFEGAPGQKGTEIFNVSSAVWGVYNHGNNNCTSVLGGTNGVSSTKAAYWLVGQAFFDGHYMDFDNAASTIGIANLKDPSGASFK